MENDLFASVAPSPQTKKARSQPTSQIKREDIPLAERMRPRHLDEVLGQEDLLGREGLITRMIKQHTLPSMILWGPPGVGKTTIARLLARESHLVFKQISAVFSGVSELKKIFDDAKKSFGKILLFVDEIHRFNKAQQDAFLPVIEDGTLTLIGATTENPSFALNSALLSRCQVMVLKRLTPQILEALLDRAEELMKRKLPLTPKARELFCSMADGDGRYLLNIAQQLFALKTNDVLDTTSLPKLLARRALQYDKNSEEHYNLISALHKSLRGSDPDASLYWFARMVCAGEDPRYLARRLLRVAVEDVGLAEPRAMEQAIAAWETYERLGSPEGELALAQLVVFLACAPKSNSVYAAYNDVIIAAKRTGSLPPPAHIVNAPTKMMKDMGYGRGYQYDHNTKYGFSGQNYFPQNMERHHYYHPTQHGYEKQLSEHLQQLQKLREQIQSHKGV